ncbi:MAG: CvpA family protein [Candidatus Falkowbacteria bacterium]
MDLSFLSNINLGDLGVYDAILIVIILGFTVYGFLKGIIRMMGELIGYIVGIWVAGHYFIPFYEWTQSIYMSNESAGHAISFLLLLFIARKIVMLLVIALDRFFNFIAIIPFFGLVNRLAGALFGFFTVNIVLGILIYFASRYSLGFSFDKFLVDSNIVPYLLRFGEFFSPLLPEVFRQLHSLL